MKITVSGTNFGKAANDYSTYRAGFPDSLFERLTEYEIGLANQKIVDLGTGTGTLARGFALRGCDVTGVDPDSRMITAAQALDLEHDVNTKYVEATAESTGLSRGIADVVTAGQCWHWFDQPKAIAEASRLLKPGGRLVIANFDWLPLKGNVVEATEKLIVQFNPDWNMGGGNGMYPQYISVLNDAGLTSTQTFFYDVDTPYSAIAWRGRMRASAGVAALDGDSIQNFDEQLATILADRYPDEVLAIPHRVFAIVAE